MERNRGARQRFDVPDEILSVIPEDPYDQLDLARRITSKAVMVLEADAASVRQKIRHKDRRIEELESKVSRLEIALQDAELRLRIANDHMKLLKGKGSSSSIMKKLSRRFSKMGTLDTHEPSSISTAQSKADSGDDGHTSPMSGYKASHSNVSPKIRSAAGSPPRILRSASTKQYKEGAALSSWYPSSQQSSATNTPRLLPRPVHNSGIDGKEFFRQAKSRLAIQQFSSFLANIKEFNERKQSLEETLKKSEEIFGTDNRDLFELFKGLLSRKIGS